MADPHDDDALDLRHQRPDYVTDVSGETVDGDDLSEEVAPSVGTDPQTTGDLDVDKPHVTLDEDAVRRAEAEGKGYQ